MVHLEVLFLLSAVATEVLSQAADAHDGQDDQEDDDEDPQGAREELILLAAAVTAALESFRAGAVGGQQVGRVARWVLSRGPRRRTSWRGSH